MTAGGPSNTDAGKKDTVGGLSREFYRRVGRHYGVEEEWKFELHVAEKVLREMLDESGTPIYFQQFVKDVEMSGGRILSIRMEGGLQVRARSFIDCS